MHKKAFVFYSFDFLFKRKVTDALKKVNYDFKYNATSLKELSIPDMAK